MTTYTAIANTEIDQDSPVTQPLMAKLRDNPIAIVSGATGAPRINPGAHGYPATGSVVVWRSALSGSNVGQTTGLIREAHVICGSGSLTAAATYGAVSGTATLTVRVNGATVTGGSFSTALGSSSVTAAVSVSFGDVLSFHLANNTALAESTVSGMQIRAAVSGVYVA